jgi:hypothetical protein
MPALEPTADPPVLRACTIRLELSDAEIHRTRAAFDGAHSIFAAWAPRHGMTLRCWELSLCSIRAYLEHPSGGTRCIEWLIEEPQPAALHLYWWEDHIAHGVRRSWRPEPRMERCRPGQLQQQLDAALERLLAPRAAAEYGISSLRHC